jgi:hypothetical protein
MWKFCQARLAPGRPHIDDQRRFTLRNDRFQVGSLDTPDLLGQQMPGNKNNV